MEQNGRRGGTGARHQHIVRRVRIPQNGSSFSAKRHVCCFVLTPLPNAVRTPLPNVHGIVRAYDHFLLEAATKALEPELVRDFASISLRPYMLARGSEGSVLFVCSSGDVERGTEG